MRVRRISIGQKSKGERDKLVDFRKQQGTRGNIGFWAQEAAKDDI